MDTNAEHMERIAAHLAHAKAKHPHFADAFVSEETRGYADGLLADARKLVATDAAQGRVIAEGLLICEVAEIFEAFVNGRAEDAVEECYDAVAVLLRMAEWIRERGCAS